MPKTGDKISYAFSFIVLNILVATPLYIIRYIYRKKQSLKTEIARSQYRTLFDNISPKNSLNYYFNAFFCLRRLLLAIAIVFLSHFPVLQFFSVILFNLLTLIYLSRKPFRQNKANFHELFNEICVTYYSVLLLCTL